MLVRLSILTNTPSPLPLPLFFCFFFVITYPPTSLPSPFFLPSQQIFVHQTYHYVSDLEVSRLSSAPGAQLIGPRERE